MMILSSDGFKRYCDRIIAKEPVAWGGHAEIVALASLLQREIHVHTSTESKPMVMGQGSQAEPLHIS